MNFRFEPSVAYVWRALRCYTDESTYDHEVHAQYVDPISNDECLGQYFEDEQVTYVSRLQEIKSIGQMCELLNEVKVFYTRIHTRDLTCAELIKRCNDEQAKAQNINLEQQVVQLTARVKFLEAVFARLFFLNLWKKT